MLAGDPMGYETSSCRYGQHAHGINTCMAFANIRPKQMSFHLKKTLLIYLTADLE